VTTEDYVIVGFTNDQRVCKVMVSQILKLPTSILYRYYTEFGCNYDEKVTITEFDYDAFQIIIESIDQPQILMTQQNAHILQIARNTGLIKSNFLL